MNNLYFAKLNQYAIIPTKRDEDAGRDVYACFEQDYIKIYPHETKMIPTGIASAFCCGYVALLMERGSTGTKGMAQRCGVIDSGYRGEWMCPITNTTDNPMFIVKKEYYEKHSKKAMFAHATIYPYEKAITQVLFVALPEMDQKEISYDELKEIASERGIGKLGSSGK